MIKLPVLAATALMMGSNVFAAPAIAVSSETLIQESESLVQEVEDGTLVAGRLTWEQQGHIGPTVGSKTGRRYNRKFEAYYLRRCRYKVTIEQCYDSYRRAYGSRNGIFRGQRVFDRSDRIDDLWRNRNRKRVKVVAPKDRFKKQQKVLKNQIKVRDRQLKQREKRIDRLQDRLEDISERNRKRRRGRR